MSTEATPLQRIDAALSVCGNSHFCMLGTGYIFDNNTFTETEFDAIVAQVRLRYDLTIASDSCERILRIDVYSKKELT